MENTEKWVSLDTICEHLGLSRDTVKKMVISQGMPGYHINRKWKFKISEVDEWIHSKRPHTETIAEEEKGYAKND